MAHEWLPARSVIAPKSSEPSAPREFAYCLLLAAILAGTHWLLAWAAGRGETLSHWIVNQFRWHCDDHGKRAIPGCPGTGGRNLPAWPRVRLGGSKSSLAPRWCDSVVAVAGRSLLKSRMSPV